MLHSRLSRRFVIRTDAGEIFKPKLLRGVRHQHTGHLYLGETLPEDQQEMTIDRVIIRENTLIGRVEDSQISEQDFGASYDFTCVLPGEEQFYTDVNAIYASVLGRSVSPTEYRFEVTTELPAGRPWWLDWIPMIGLFVFFGILWYFIMRQQAGSGKGMMNFGKSRARLTDPNGNKVTFQITKPGEEPVMKTGGADPVTAYEYCNLHGFWKGEE